MRVLLDENIPHDLIGALAEHSVTTVHGAGWAGTKNGALLKRAHGAIDAFVTMDTSLEHQQNVSVLQFGIVVVGALSNRMQDLAPLVPGILEALGKSGRGRWSMSAAPGRVLKRPDHLKKTCSRKSRPDQKWRKPVRDAEEDRRKPETADVCRRPPAVFVSGRDRGLRTRYQYQPSPIARCATAGKPA